MYAKPVYVVDGARTPFLKSKNRPGVFSAGDLATQAGKTLLARQKFAPQDLDEVILGCAAPSVDEVNIGRVAALRMGCGEKVPGWTVMRNCASGMQALDSGDQQHPRRALEPGARRRRGRALARAAALQRQDGELVFRFCAQKDLQEKKQANSRSFPSAPCSIRSSAS